MDPLQQSRLSVLIRTLEGIGGATTVTPDRTRVVAPLVEGTRVSGRVVDNLTDGRSLIDIEGTLYHVRLPAALRAALGDRITLTVLQAGDSPTFGAARSAPESEPVPSARIDLSALATRLRQIVAASAGDAAALRAMPVLPAASGEGRVIEPPLRQALEGSGLFYESHQAEWVDGRRELATLRQEPQGQHGFGEALETAGDERVDAARAPTPSSPPVAPGPTEAPEGLSAQVATLVDRQLQALGNQQIHWTGQLWPGQPLDWTIREEPERDHQGDGGTGDEAPRWSSRLRLELPRLGAVEAVLHLKGQSLELDLRAVADARATLQAAFPDLQSALSARGLQITGLRVQEQGDAAPAAVGAEAGGT